MDTENLIAHARARFEHAAAKRLLKEKYQGKLNFAHAGGMWKTDPSTIAYLQLCDLEEVVLLDLYENPIKVNVRNLMTEMQQRWQEQMNAWLVEFEQTTKNR